MFFGKNGRGIIPKSLFGDLGIRELTVLNFRAC